MKERQVPAFRPKPLDWERREIFAGRESIVIDSRDKNIRLFKQSPEVATSYEEIVKLLRAGFALTPSDFREIYERNGASVNTGAFNVAADMSNGRFTRRTGIPIRIMGKQFKYYLDARLTEEATDIVERLQRAIQKTKLT